MSKISLLEFYTKYCKVNGKEPTITDKNKNHNGNNKDSMDLKKELWDKLTQMEEKKRGKADTYYDILALFNVVKQSELLVCDNCKYTAIYEGYEISYLECMKCGKTKAY